MKRSLLQHRLNFRPYLPGCSMKQREMMNFSKTQKIAYMALLIALQVILGRFAGIMTPIVSISFSFVPLAINAIVFGPVCATVSSAIADILGALLFPQGLGIYFPGYTVSAALNGLVYGLILYRKPKQLWRIILVCIVQGVFISLGLSTYWVHMMTGEGYLAVLPARILQNAIMIPVKALVIWILAYRLTPYIWKSAIPELNKRKNEKAVEPLDKNL